MGTDPHTLIVSSPLNLLHHLVLFLLLTHNVVNSSSLRRSQSRQSTTSTLFDALKDVPSLTEWQTPSAYETISAKQTRLELLHRTGAKQHMVLSTGTSVTLWAPDQLTPVELSEAAKTVNHLAKEPSDCFCTFRAVTPAPSTEGLTSTIEPHAAQNCVCAVRGKLTENVPNLLPTDFYGTTLKKGTQMQSIVRYSVPIGSKFDIPTQHLILSMDAGDRRSYDARDPSIWKNVAANDEATTTDDNINNENNNLIGHLHGFIGFNKNEGFGSLRMGAHGNRDYIIIPHLDISKPSMPSVTVEVWLKLTKYDHSTGRAFGNSLDEKTLGGRSLFLHNVLYGVDRNLEVPPSSFDPEWTGKHGHLGATSGHLYDSEISPPKLHVWMQFVTIWCETEVTMYQNGHVVGREAVYDDGAGAISSLGSSDFVIGNHEFKHKGGKYKLNGYVGLVRVWSKALENDDVEKLFEHSRERFEN